MNSRPTILIIENSIGLTGAVKSITRSSFDLRSFFDFAFVIPKNSKGKLRIEDFGLWSVHELPMVELSKRLYSILIYIPLLLINAISLIKIINQKRVSLIHVNDLYNLLPVVVRLLGNSTPYVCHIRFMPDRFPDWLFKFWLKLHIRYAEKIITVSQSAAQLLPKHSKISFIHGELPLNERYSAVVPGFVNRPSCVFLYLSNFMIGKGQNFALEAFSQIHQALPTWKIRFVGSDLGLKKNQIYVKNLKEQAEKLNITDKIEWKEFTNDVEYEYKQADIVLNFSESESFSETCVEALFFGRPLIATNCGGPAEIIDNYVTGVLVPNKDIAAMGGAMMRLAVDKDKRETMAIQARIVVRKRFSKENTSFKLKEVYHQALRGRK